MEPQRTQAQWFAEEIQPHQIILKAWLQKQYPTDGDFDDIVQEASVRVLRAHERGGMRSPKAFLFATARNLMLDRLRHSQVARTESLAEIDELSATDESAGIPESIAHAEDLELLTKAIQSLPERCREIITLRKVYGLSQKDTAAELGITERAVEAQGAIGLRGCIRYFATHSERPPHRP